MPKGRCPDLLPGECVGQKEAALGKPGVGASPLLGVPWWGRRSGESFMVVASGHFLTRK